MKTTKEQRAELRARTPTSQQSMYQLYVRRAELHAVLDDLDEAEARAERLREALVRANNVLSDIGDSDGPTRDGESMSLALAETWAANALPMIRAALAETSPKTSERDGREGDPAETPQEPGTSSRGIPRTDDDGERRGNIHPAQAPDDAERAAREWLETPDEDGRYVCDDSDDDFCAKLAALLRARDEATWNAAVEACAKELEDPKLFNVHPTMLRRIRDLKKHGGPASG